jgi:transforming growth factor-beta-induced protein
MRPTFVSSLLAPLACLTLAQQKPVDLTELLNEQKNLTEFTTLLTKQYGDIYANLSFQNDVTILAASNDAFAKIPYSTLGPAFQSNQSNIIRSVLEYHIIPGLHPADSYNGSFKFTPTWLNDKTYTNVTGGQVVGGVQQAGNVNIYTSGMGSRSTLVQAVSSPDHGPALRRYTNLHYQNLVFNGGLVHVIDTFLVPPTDFISTVPQFNLTAVGGAVTDAKLGDYLNTATDLTIFAPYNDAFQKLGTTLSAMSTVELASLLEYHVVNGSHSVGYSANLPNGTVLRTRQGGNLTITFASNSLFVNSARVLQEDILIANGVIHVIDNILDYNASNIRPVPATPTQPAVLQGAPLTGNVLPFASDLPTSVSSFSSSTPTPGASSFGISDIGSEPTSTSSTMSTHATQTGTAKKGSGYKVEAPRAHYGGLLGAVVVGVGFL